MLGYRMEGELGVREGGGGVGECDIQVFLVVASIGFSSAFYLVWETSKQNNP